MKIIQELSDMIEEEIEDAGKYAKCALHYKEENSALGEMFYKLSNEEVGHVQLLHAQVVKMIDEHRKENGNPPETMLMLYKILHQKHIENLAAVKGMLALYKEG